MDATLNLAKDFGQYGDSLEHKVSTFPAGEKYINITVPFGVSSVRINTRARSSNDIMTLLLACDSLKRQGVSQIEVFMPYLPYSRQDRVCHKGDSFSLSVMCNLLRALNIRLVTYDLHSNVAEVLLDGSDVIHYNNHREVFDFYDYLGLANEKVALIVPDAGARNKAELLYAKCNRRFDTIVYLNKKRSGAGLLVDEITDNIQGMVAFVVDDICDGGATFLAIGERLKQAMVSNSYLFVSHGVFSKGVLDLIKFYKKIGTTNSVTDFNFLYGVKNFNLDY
jgi:ribose-phosphate pyrophosphokinase